MLLKREMDVDNDSDGHLQRALPLLGKTPDTHRQASMYRLQTSCSVCYYKLLWLHGQRRGCLW